MLALGRPVGDVEHRRVEAAIGDHDAHEQLDEAGLVGKAAEHEDIEAGEREADERQHQAEEQEARQRVLAAKAGHPELGERALVGQRPAQVQPLDDVAHADRLLLAQALATPVGLVGQAGALLGAQFLALQRDAFMRDFSTSPPKAGSSVKMVANTAMPTSKAMMNAGSINVFITVVDMAHTSKFIILRITKTPIIIHTSDTPMIRWPASVVNSGLM